MENAIPPEELALMKRWVDTWKFVTGPELERIKKEELRALTDEEGLADADMLLSMPVSEWMPEWRESSSGLVAQQSLFANWGKGE